MTQVFLSRIACDFFALCIRSGRLEGCLQPSHSENAATCEMIVIRTTSRGQVDKPETVTVDKQGPLYLFVEDHYLLAKQSEFYNQVNMIVIQV